MREPKEKERTDGRTTVWEFELIPWAYKLTSLQLHAQELFRIVLSAKGLISRADREDSSMSVCVSLVLKNIGVEQSYIAFTIINFGQKYKDRLALTLILPSSLPLTPRFTLRLRLTLSH